MSQPKNDKIEGKKSRKIIFGSKLSAPNNEPTLRRHQKIDKKSRKKNSKIIFGSELSKANNEPFLNF